MIKQYKSLDNIIVDKKYTSRLTHYSFHWSFKSNISYYYLLLSFNNIKYITQRCNNHYKQSDIEIIQCKKYNYYYSKDDYLIYKLIAIYYNYNITPNMVKARLFREY